MKHPCVTGLRRTAPAQARAFTLVELLVTIAITGALIALLLPAVLSARESSRRTSCRNRLKQTALAALNYQSTHLALPPGLLGPTPARSVFAAGRVAEQDHQMIGTLPFLLPYIEEQGIAAEIQPDMLDVDREPSFQIWVQNVDTWEAASHPVSVFRCPSALRELPEKGLIVFNNPYYDHDVHKLQLEGAPVRLKFSAALGATDYLGSAGHFAVVDDPDTDPLRGPFYNRSKTRPAHITDGLSKTLLFGEASGAVQGGRRFLAHAWMGAGPMPTAFGIGDLAMWNNFASQHTGVVGFSLCDGSVRFLTVEIAPDVLLAASAIADGGLSTKGLP